MFEFLKRKKKTKGGSTILEYDQSKTDKDMIGVQVELDEKLHNSREEVFDQLFGECESVSHEIIPMLPHIDVFIYKPGYQGREFFTLVSSGMSDMPMTLPDGISDEYERAEIVMYVTEPKDEYINLIRHFARYPHKYETYFANSHTIPNGQPAEPFFEQSVLDTIAFIPTIVSPDNEFTDLLFKKSGVNVQLLHLTPITTPECEFKLEYGIDELYDLFDDKNHSFILDETRGSYV
ncbi:MAG: suppressor of fused domain protein [Gammaproteobacteria bacterium]|nr:suppressor of fused domain protein [Gammaproteobacteria bacterium]